jgi:hypothetical protein
MPRLLQSTSVDAASVVTTEPAGTWTAYDVSRASRHTREHTSRERETIHAPLEEVVGDELGTPEPPLHLIWGRVVPDIPDFCRELVAALAEE